MKKMFKEHDLVKLVSMLLLLVVILTWIIPTGSFGRDAVFTDGEMLRIGLVHLGYGMSFAISSNYMQIAFLVMVGIFYGVISHTEGYKALVARLAKFGKGKETGVVLGVSLLTALSTSILNNTIVLLIFMPFLVTVLRRIGLSKLTAFASTFGAMLVGLLGATIGTEGLTGFVSYISYNSEITMTTELAVRIGILTLGYILHSIILLALMKKEAKKAKEEKEDDVFAVEEPKKKNKKIWPTVVAFGTLLVFMVLAYVSWDIFDIEVFSNFHEKILGVTIGEFEVFRNIFGIIIPNIEADIVVEFGKWYLFNYIVVIAFVTLFVAIVSKMKLNDFLSNAWEGMKKIAKPTAFLIFAYMIFIVLYWSPIVPTIINELGKLTDSFNPFVASLQALIAGFFNSDLAYVGFSLSYYITSFAEEEANIMYLIFTLIHGLVQFITPISIFLLFGLSYMDIPYKKWMGYIWKFVVGMFICLLVIFTLLTYL